MKTNHNPILNRAIRSVAAMAFATAAVFVLLAQPAVAQSLFWQGDGTANLWDINTTANWVTNFGGTTFTYNDPAQVTFNDFGSNNVPVTLNSVVSPGAVTFNITNHAYTLAGSGNITGPEGVTISGGNTLTNLLQNDYIGGTVLNNGSKLVLGNGGSTGAAGSGTITMGNTTSQVIVNEAAAITLPTVTGSGGTPQVIQNGSGTTTLAGSDDNSRLGAVVNNGILVLGKTSSSTHALGGATTVNTGGTLQLGGTGGDQIFSGVTVTLAGGTFDAAGNNEGFTGLNGYGTLMDSVGSSTLTLTANAGLKPSGGTLNANVNLHLLGAPSFQVQSDGVFNLQGGTVACDQLSTASSVNAGGVFNMSGGSFSSGFYISMGSSPTQSAFLNFNGGTFNCGGAFLQGLGGVTTVSVSSNAVLNVYMFSYGDNGSKVTNYFNGGLVSVWEFNQRGSGVWQAFFNGSTIQARQNDVHYMPNSANSTANQHAYISTNGLIIDCQGFNISVSQNLQHDPSLGAGLDGGLTKLGTGSLTLTGTNTFNGSVSNTTGTLVFKNSGSYNNMFIGDNATNQVNLVAAGTSLTNNTLTIGSSGSGTQGLIFNLGTFGSPSVPLMTVNGVVTNSGNVGITFTAPVLTPGMIPLMKYGSMDAANFAGTWSVNPYPYVTLTLTNDTAHNLVSVIVVQGVTPVWKGNVNSEWDTTTLNWTTNGVATTYVETTPPGTPVSFNDTAVNFTVDISAATVNPAFFIMTNSSHDYTFTGSYGLGGTGALFKSGAGALVLSNATAANTYSGITTVTGGSLVAGAANMLSPNSTMTFNNSVLNLGNDDQAFGSLTLNNTPLLGNVTLTGNGGALIFNSGASSFTLGTLLAGSIALNFNGTGEMTINNDNSSDSGVWLVNSGSVRVQNGNGLGEGTGFDDAAHVVIASGARIVLDGSFTIPKYFYLNGAGPDGAGCLIVTNGNVVVNDSPCNLDNMSTIYVSAGSSILFQGQWNGNNTKFFHGSVTKSGPGILSMDAGPNNSVGMIVAQGSLVTSHTATSGFITVNSGAALAGSGSWASYLAVAAGATLTPDQNGYIGTLSCYGGLTNAGAMTLQILKTTSATNADQIACTGGFVNTGTLTVIINAGTTLPFVAGDAFKLFTLTNYAALTGLTPTLPALPAGLGWTNQLALNGSIAVVSTSTVSTTPFSVGTSVSGNQLTLTWPADHTGWRLQVQTNSLSAGLGGTWVDVPGATTVDILTFTIDPAQGTVFYRMVYP